MRTKTLLLLIKIIAVYQLSANILNAQCSDAGVCFIGSKHSVREHQISANYIFGKSGKIDDLTFHSILINGHVKLFTNSFLLITIPWYSIHGPLGGVDGIGDLTLLWNQIITKEQINKLSLQFGMKIATGRSNAKNFPQSYQPGLGTNDVLLGIVGNLEPWIFAIGYQLSKGRSHNNVSRLKRGDDLFGRVGYTITANDFLINLEVLGIKRLQESSVLDTTISFVDTFTSIPESDQFQLNLLGTFSYAFSEVYSLVAQSAIPLRSRNINVDGLTRSITLSAGVQILL